MKQVTKKEFFATVGQLDVHPWIFGNYDNEWGYKSHWKLRNGLKVGESDGGTHLQDDRYFVFAPRSKFDKRIGRAYNMRHERSKVVRIGEVARIFARQGVSAGVRRQG